MRLEVKVLQAALAGGGCKAGSEAGEVEGERCSWGWRGCRQAGGEAENEAGGEAGGEAGEAAGRLEVRL